MPAFSILILTKNEAHNIARCLQSVNGMSDDILVLDSGSTDRTVSIATSLGARVLTTEWKGYGATKNDGNRMARHDWILSLDADEEMNPELREAIRDVFTETPPVTQVYALRRRMVYSGQVLNHGSVGHEYRVRIFNRNNASWSADAVHEDIRCIQPCSETKLRGYLWHHSYVSDQDHRQRLERYARLSAGQMHTAGLHAGLIKRFISPVFHFVKNFIFRGGFLDGRAGYRFAKNEMWYVRRKYHLLYTGFSAAPSSDNRKNEAV